MTCLETQEQISRYFDNELGDQEASAMFLHAGTCAQCREFFSDLIRLRDGLVNEKETQSVPAPLWSASGKRVSSSIPSAPPRAGWMRSRRVSLSFPIAAVLALFLIVASAVVTFSTIEGGRQPAPKEVILMSLPTVEVQGSRLPNQPIQQ